MGMPIVVEIRDDDVSSSLVDDVFEWLRRVDATFSTYKESSEISRINRGELSVDDASREVTEILERCEELRHETDGYFDARRNGTLDPSGLVKGWSVDRAAEILDNAGVCEYAVNAGGDMRLRGTWRLGIQHPRERLAVAAVIETADSAVATSGAYARGAHIVDPRTGGAPEGVLSVTITGPELATADAYATAAFAMGPERGPHWTARLRGFEAMTILADGRVLKTPGFPDAETDA
jgi:thiamine biosynthesis lipoprotein